MGELILSDVKQCSYCAEDIKTASIVCKHCGRELPGFEENSRQRVERVKAFTIGACVHGELKN